MVYRERDENEEDIERKKDEGHPLLEGKRVTLVTDAFPSSLSSS